MREWWRYWGSFVRFCLICAVISGLFVGGLTYAIVTAPRDCHIVYVQTTPVDGQPAMERRDVCR
jgi:hypothetical protein